MTTFNLLYGEEILPINGEFPVAGSRLPSFMLVDDAFNDVSLARYDGQPVALITLLSFDEERHGGLRMLREALRFLERWPLLRPIAISVDSPSTLRRVRQAHGLPGVTLLSTLRGRDFHKHFGVLITAYPLAGYTAPALIVADPAGTVLYAERLRDTVDDFDFAAVERALKDWEAAEAEARRQQEEAAARQQAEAEENERQEKAAVDRLGRPPRGENRS